MWNRNATTAGTAGRSFWTPSRQAGRVHLQAKLFTGLFFFVSPLEGKLPRTQITQVEFLYACPSFFFGNFNYRDKPNRKLDHCSKTRCDIFWPSVRLLINFSDMPVTDLNFRLQHQSNHRPASLKSSMLPQCPSGYPVLETRVQL